MYFSDFYYDDILFLNNILQNSDILLIMIFPYFCLYRNSR